MKPVILKVARIGNSRGVRLPAATLARYAVGDEVIMEERSDGILLRRPGSASARLSWADTAAAMAAESEGWSEWDSAAADGLDDLPWTLPAPRRVADQPSEFKRAPRKPRP